MPRSKRKIDNRKIDIVTTARLRKIFYTAAACAALVGLAESTYLAVMFFTGEMAVCGGSSDCFQVLGSKYAHIGPVPISAFGALAYFAAFSCATFAAFGYVRVRRFLALIVGAMFATTLWLLFVQAFLLHAFCRYCLFSAALVFLLAGIVVATPATD
jgi:uncharacterized membrane protein